MAAALTPPLPPLASPRLPPLFAERTWLFFVGVCFLVVNLAQLGYTAFFLRRKSAVMTAAIKTSAEAPRPPLPPRCAPGRPPAHALRRARPQATLLGMMEREDLLELVGDVVDSAVDETMRQLRPFDGPVKARPRPLSRALAPSPSSLPRSIACPRP